MSDSNTTVTTPEQTTTAPQPERTFTQSELDAIVKDRLAREKGKYADYEELKTKAAQLDQIEENNKSELQKATEKADALQKELDRMKKTKSINDLRNKVASELGVPANLLTGEDEESCKAQANNILAFAKKSSYPSVPDGGETVPPTVTKDSIMSIKSEKARLKALEEYLQNGGK